MTNRLLVGQALAVAEGYGASYESLLNGLVTALGVTPRHEDIEGDPYYALMDLLKGLKDLYDVLDGKLDALDTRVDTYHP